MTESNRIQQNQIITESQNHRILLIGACDSVILLEPIGACGVVGDIDLLNDRIQQNQKITESQNPFDWSL